MPILKRASGEYYYVAPRPTVEMVALAKVLKYDPNNDGGSLPLWDLADDDYFAACWLLHDIGYVRGGSAADRDLLDDNCIDDCDVLVDVLPIGLKRTWEYARMEAAEVVIQAGGPGLWHAEDYNTLVTRQQSREMALEAMTWINYNCVLMSKPIRYPTAPFSIE